YVRENFIYGREFLNDADLDEQRSRWLEKANGRIHGTTNEVPRERFAREERHRLLPLARRPYHSLVLVPLKPVVPKRRIPESRIVVERRPLSAYAALVGGAR